MKKLNLNLTKKETVFVSVASTSFALAVALFSYVAVKHFTAPKATTEETTTEAAE